MNNFKELHCASSDTLFPINLVAEGEKVIKFHTGILAKQLYMILKSKDVILD